MPTDRFNKQYSCSSGRLNFLQLVCLDIKPWIAANTTHRILFFALSRLWGYIYRFYLRTNLHLCAVVSYLISLRFKIGQLSWGLPWFQKATVPVFPGLSIILFLCIVWFLSLPTERYRPTGLTNRCEERLIFCTVAVGNVTFHPSSAATSY